MLWYKKQKIALVEVTGAIAGPTRKFLLETFETLQRQKWRALVLRIDSPGGVVGDCQEIHAGLQRLRAHNIRTVASFGNISASGGVYIGVGAEKIVSNPGTITGSIGVILRGNNLEKLLARVGVSFKTIKSGPFKDILSFDRPTTPEEEVILQKLIDSSYRQFVEAVAAGRQLSPATVRSFADGRVFTGEQALALGLVDRLGTLEDARRWAAELAGLDPEKAKFQVFKPAKPLFNRLLPGSAARNWLEQELTWRGLPLWLWLP
ncbi:MAG: signal peptide peptidase SppA [Pseudanabaenaceae cyanobacterium]